MAWAGHCGPRRQHVTRPVLRDERGRQSGVCGPRFSQSRVRAEALPAGPQPGPWQGHPPASAACAFAGSLRLCHHRGQKAARLNPERLREAGRAQRLSLPGAQPTAQTQATAEAAREEVGPGRLLGQPGSQKPPLQQPVEAPRGAAPAGACPCPTPGREHSPGRAAPPLQEAEGRQDRTLRPTSRVAVGRERTCGSARAPRSWSDNVD